MCEKSHYNSNNNKKVIFISINLAYFSAGLVLHRWDSSA